VPELPEVQTIVDVLIAAGLPGRSIEKASVHWPRTIAVPAADVFCRQVARRTISRIRRRAKYIILDLDDGQCLLVHLRMTGRLELVARTSAGDPHVHVILYLDDGRCLVFHDTRKFGRFYLTPEPETIIGSLGPEPLGPGFSARRLGEQLAGRRRQIKPILLDQTFLAGLGNIYVDEALWTASLHPMRLGHSLGWDEVKRLHRAIRSVLRQGIRNAGTTLGRGQGNFMSPRNEAGRNARRLRVFRRTGQPCRRCRQPIERIVVAQRSTHICSRCQKLP
jgi:formamidopyrimidine-DNA glycosylase